MDTQAPDQSVSPEPQPEPRARGIAVAVFALVVVALAVFVLFREIRGWRERHYPAVSYEPAPTYSAPGEAVDHAESFGPAGAPVRVVGYLPPSSCADQMRAMLREAAKRHGGGELRVEIVPFTSPEGRKLKEEKGVKCGTVWIKDKLVSARHGGEPEAVRKEIEAALASVARKGAPSQRQEGSPKNPARKGV